MAKLPGYLEESKFCDLVEWGSLLEAVERGLAGVSRRDSTVLQPPRTIVHLPSKEGALFTMPAFSSQDNALGCKLVTSFPGNSKLGLPSIMATVLLFDSDTGQFKVAMEGNSITGWRTAAASVVATKHLHRGEKGVLAILGAGVQAKAHSILFQKVFNFREVRIWNRTPQRAANLVAALGENTVYHTFHDRERCVRGADVIVTCTYAEEPIVEHTWLKPGVHINAVGVGLTHHSELDQEIYEKSVITVDTMEAAKQELRGLTESGIKLWAELGEVINGTKELPQQGPFSVFHSLGMAIEDVLVADLLFKAYQQKVKGERQ